MAGLYRKKPSRRQIITRYTGLKTLTSTSPQWMHLDLPVDVPRMARNTEYDLKLIEDVDSVWYVMELFRKLRKSRSHRYICFMESHCEIAVLRLY